MENKTHHEAHRGLRAHSSRYCHVSIAMWISPCEYRHVDFGKLSCGFREIVMWVVGTYRGGAAKLAPQFFLQTFFARIKFSSLEFDCPRTIEFVYNKVCGNIISIFQIILCYPLLFTIVCFHVIMLSSENKRKGWEVIPPFSFLAILGKF